MRNLSNPKLSILALLFQLFLPIFSLADFINLIKADQCETILEIFIEDDHIRVQFEIGPKDFANFSHIIPVEFFEDGYTEQNKAQLLRQFMMHRFLLKANGKTLTGKVMTTEQRPRLPRASLYTGQVDSALLNKKIIFVEIVYPISLKPQFLTITPPIESGYQATLANIGFITYHKSIPINDLRYLGVEEKLNLDWQDPWYTNFENKNLRRHHNSSFMSFLYVEPYEVRHEILGRIKDFEDWIDLDYQMEDMIDVEDQDSIKNLIANFLINRNIVRIDGEERSPIIDKIHFVEVQLSGIQIMEVPKPLPYSSAIIGIIFAYPDQGLAKEVTMLWDMFNDRIQTVPTITTDPAGPWPYDLMRDDSLLTYTNFLKNYKLPVISEQRIEQASIDLPYLSILIFLGLITLMISKKWRQKPRSKVLISFGVILALLAMALFPMQSTIKIPFIEKKSYSDPEARNLINQLLKNTYRAFDFREESDIYDKLALSNEGDLLQEIYIQTRKSMIIENQGGVEAKVDEIMLTDVNQVDSNTEGLSYRCRWTVKGIIGHWGHQHKRTNKYDAIISIKPVSGVWKMYDLEIIEESRI